MSNPVSERTRQRRRILRAAAGAPIVLTLPSGAALAATSSTCKERSLDMGGEAKGAVTTTDEWVRFKVPAISFNASGGKVEPGFMLKSNGIEYWYKVDLATGLVSSVSKSGNSDVKGLNYDLYLLVDYDGFGGALTPEDPKMFVYTGTAIASPIAGTSCWNSIASFENQISSTVING